MGDFTEHICEKMQISYHKMVESREKWCMLVNGRNRVMRKKERKKKPKPKPNRRDICVLINTTQGQKNQS